MNLLQGNLSKKSLIFCDSLSMKWGYTKRFRGLALKVWILGLSSVIHNLELVIRKNHRIFGTLLPLKAANCLSNFKL